MVDITYIIDYFVTIGDKFISFLYQLMFLPIGQATDILLKSTPFSFQTFAGEVFFIKLPDFGVIGTVLDFVLDILFFPSVVVGWVSGYDVPFLVSVLTLIFWLPIVLGILKLAISLMRSLIGLGS